MRSTPTIPHFALFIPHSSRNATLSKRAAIRGQSFGKFLEQGLRRILEESYLEPTSRASAWVRELPLVPPTAATELEHLVSAPDFRPVDKSMW